MNFTTNTSNSEIAATLENGVYTSAYTPVYFKGNSKIYNFTPATIPTPFIISGLSSKAKLGENIFVENEKATVNAGALSATHDKISVNNNYTLELGNDVAQVENIIFAQNENAVILSGTTAGYKLIDGSY